MEFRIRIIYQPDRTSLIFVTGAVVQISLIIPYNRLKELINTVCRLGIESVLLQIRPTCLLVGPDIFAPESQVVLLVFRMEIHYGKVLITVNRICSCVVLSADFQFLIRPESDSATPGLAAVIAVSVVLTHTSDIPAIRNRTVGIRRLFQAVDHIECVVHRLFRWKFVFTS